ncbi:MAG: hypothetical protein ACO35I_09815, partial [Burkholderiaceae bacterium]
MPESMMAQTRREGVLAAHSVDEYVISVPDLAEARTFYTTFGLNVVDEGEGLALALDFQGVSIHSGPACMTGSNRIAPALKAAGLSSALARASVMMSTGIETTSEEVEEAVVRISRVVMKLREMSPMWEAYCEG